jgi:uncharacterized protein YjbJ (UPF0337 family)
MNSNVLEGKWKQLRGEVRRVWGKLTNSDVDKVKGSYERLAGVLQERYGYNREQAEKEISDFLTRFEQKLEQPLKERH